MNPALVLMGVYIAVTFVLQGLFFLISQAADAISPDWSLLVFLILFMCAYWLAWPIAVRITEPKTTEGVVARGV